MSLEIDKKVSFKEFLKLKNSSSHLNLLHTDSISFNTTVKKNPALRKSTLKDKYFIFDQGNFDELNHCIKIMEKTNKTLPEIHILANYLGKLEELKNFLKSSHENYKDLLITISCLLRHEFIPRNHIIFKTGI